MQAGTARRVVGIAGAFLLLGLVAFAAWPLIGEVARDSAVQDVQDASGPAHVSYIVSPHPDDSFEAWSLVEHRPAAYKVFILATHGEETGYCDPKTYRKAGYQPGLEPPADPVPHGRWTRSCQQARLHSWRRFVTDMGATDPTLPSHLRSLGTRGPFPGHGTKICRRDESNKCRSDRSAKVWVDRKGHGALVAFDLGDGDLTPTEVAWAIRTVKGHRSALGINDSLPNGPLIGGSFSNRKYDCAKYPHPDHHAVQEALRNVNFHMEYQAAPTCKDDPHAVRAETVSKASTRAAFKIGPHHKRLGSHVKNYGWLYDPYYPVDRKKQRKTFHTHQHFWVRWRHQ